MLDHPNIVKLLNHFEDDKNVYLVLELIRGVIFVLFISKFFKRNVY